MVMTAIDVSSNSNVTVSPQPSNQSLRDARPPNFTVEGADEGPIQESTIDHSAQHAPRTEQTHDVELAGDTGNDEKSQEGNGHNESMLAIAYWKSVSLLTIIRYILSLAITVFAIVNVSAAIFTKQTIATGEKQVPPLIAFIVFWGLLICLALLEAGLNCTVGLKPIDSERYATSHPKTRACMKVAHTGDNLERFIVGRQYLDLMCVFLTSFMVSTIDGASVLGMPKIINDVFLESGVAVILITIIFGQLVVVINAAHSMLDFMNNYIMIAVTYAALAVEASGILHSVYLMQMFFSYVSGKSIESNEAPRTKLQKLWFWIRIAMSLGLLIISSIMVAGALIQNKTTMWKGVSPVASLLLLIALVGIVGIMEGLQITLFVVIHLPSEEINKNPRVRQNCDLVFRKHGKLQSFLVGRQICQTVMMFIFAKITTVQIRDDNGNLFGVSDSLQLLFETGVLGALMSTIVASLSWRILASSFPMVFLANPLSTFVIKFCLIIEATGICYSSWLFAYLHQSIVGYERDATYLESEGVNENACKITKLDLQGQLSASTEEGSASGNVCDE